MVFLKKQIFLQPNWVCRLHQFRGLEMKKLDSTYFSSVNVDDSRITSNFLKGSGGVRRKGYSGPCTLLNRSNSVWSFFFSLNSRCVSWVTSSVDIVVIIRTLSSWDMP